MLELKLLLWAAIFAVIAFVYSHVLTQGGMLLNGWRNWLDRLIGPMSGDVLTDSPGRAEWLFKPLVGCYTCVSGQMALWGYLWKFHASYDVVNHLVVVSFAIYFVRFVAVLYKHAHHES